MSVGDSRYSHKGVQRHDDAGNAFGAVQGGAQVLREAFVGEGAQRRLSRWRWRWK